MDTATQKIVRANLEAAATHAALGHPGLWRECRAAGCRDAQNYVPLPFRAGGNGSDPDGGREAVSA